MWRIQFTEAGGAQIEWNCPDHNSARHLFIDQLRKMHQQGKVGRAEDSQTVRVLDARTRELVGVLRVIPPREHARLQQPEGLAL